MLFAYSTVGGADPEAFDQGHGEVAFLEGVIDDVALLVLDMT